MNWLSDCYRSCDQLDDARARSNCFRLCEERYKMISRLNKQEPNQEPKETKPQPKTEDDNIINKCLRNSILELREFEAEYRRLGRLGFDDWQIISHVSHIITKMLDEAKNNNCQNPEDLIVRIITQSLDNLGIDRNSVGEAYLHGISDEVKKVIMRIFPNITQIDRPPLHEVVRPKTTEINTYTYTHLRTTKSPQYSEKKRPSLKVALITMAVIGIIALIIYGIVYALNQIIISPNNPYQTNVAINPSISIESYSYNIIGTYVSGSVSIEDLNAPTTIKSVTLTIYCQGYTVYLSSNEPTTIQPRQTVTIPLGGYYTGIPSQDTPCTMATAAITTNNGLFTCESDTTLTYMSCTYQG